MAKQNEQGVELIGSTPSTAKSNGKKMRGNDGNLIVNYHSMFFKMTTSGKYVPWPPTIDHGKLMPSQEWSRLRKEIYGNDQLPLEFLTDFQNKRAAKIADELRKDPLYKLTETQREFALEKKLNMEAAREEGVPLEEYLRRKKIREERANKKAMDAQNAPAKIVPMQVKTTNGEVSFFLGNVKGFDKLKQKLAKG